MQEVDFNYVISHLEKEIKSLEESIANDHDKDAALCRTLATLVLNDKRESLSLIKQAVRTERDRMRTANDLSDALAYALSTIPGRRDWFTDEFHRVMEHAKGNIPPPPPKEDVETRKDCHGLVKLLEDFSESLKKHKDYAPHCYEAVDKAIIILKSLSTNVPTPSKQTTDIGKTETSKSFECRNMARILDDWRVAMKSHPCSSTQEKLRYIQRGEVLRNAAHLLRECEKILEGFGA